MKKLLTLLSIFALAHSVHADYGFQASLTPDIAIVPQGSTIRGVALNVWGENQVNGFDLGFVNGLVGDSSGFSWSFIGSYADDYTGVLWGGFFAVSHGEVIGWQSAAVNINQGSLKGLQSGLVNIGENVRGVQLGLVNYTKQMYGVQIGLANIIESNAWFDDFPTDLAKGFPIVNWSF